MSQPNVNHPLLCRCATPPLHGRAKARPYRGINVCPPLVGARLGTSVLESAGITNPMDVLSQMTYLFFMKMLNDAQIKKEATVNAIAGKLNHLNALLHD